MSFFDRVVDDVLRGSRNQDEEFVDMVRWGDDVALSADRGWLRSDTVVDLARWR